MRPRVKESEATKGGKLSGGKCWPRIGNVVHCDESRWITPYINLYYLQRRSGGTYVLLKILRCVGYRSKFQCSTSGLSRLCTNARY